MRFSSLRVTRFRNLADERLAPSPRFNVIAGANGQGKTNLLEAIYLLATLRSFRGQRNSELIQHGEKEAIVEGDFERGPNRRTATLRVIPRQKQIKVNGKTLRRVADFFGAVNTVLFVPEDIGVFRAGPADRRLLFDRMIFSMTPAYAEESKHYEQALKSRNKLLKEEHVDRDLIRVYEDQLVHHGARVMARRRAYLDTIANPFSATFSEIFGTPLAASLRYAPNIEVPETDAAFADAYHAAFARGWRRDRALGYTSVGPHRDDIVGELDGRDAGRFGSQGQQRAFVLALKISEIRALRERHGDDPILLLDDVSSELDATRSTNLFHFLAQGSGQVFVTTTDPAYVRLEDPTVWWVENGHLKAT